jgi:hypothetical protein
MNLEAQKYPIGRLTIPKKISTKDLDEAKAILQTFPEKLKLLTHTLNDAQLDTPYREGGWSVRQVVHHIADSHNHAYNRFRWTLTEDKPTIKAYDQDSYAKSSDYITQPIAWSIEHIEVLHKKLVYIIESLTDEQWERSFIHPETGDEVNLKEMAMTYSWHSMHHYAHINNVL